jgi:hypothetical protein
VTTPSFDATESRHTLGETDFSISNEGATFTADGDRFQLVPELPGVAHLAITDQFSRLAELIRDDPMKAIDGITSLIKMLMTPSSAERFIERMRGGDKPIGLQRAVRVVKWAVEQVTGRPTQPDEPSLTG